jgi:DNA-binding NarL/FixJ family response regulator
MKSLSPTPVNGQKEEPFCGNDPKYPIKVSIVADDEKARLALRLALESSADFVCAGAYRSGEEALQGMPRSSPQVVLVDLRMPAMSGIEWVRRLKDLLPGLAVIFVDDLLGAVTMREAFRAGGDDYLVKPLVFAQCLATIRFAAERWPGNGGRTYTGSARGLPQLDSREIALLENLQAGLLYKEIAPELGLSDSMLKKVQHNLFIKLEVENRTEAVNWYEARRNKSE